MANDLAARIEKLEALLAQPIYAKPDPRFANTSRTLYEQSGIPAVAHDPLSDHTQLLRDVLPDLIAHFRNTAAKASN